jgi:hypothetical protein
VVVEVCVCGCVCVGGQHTAYTQHTQLHTTCMQLCNDAGSCVQLHASRAARWAHVLHGTHQDSCPAVCTICAMQTRPTPHRTLKPPPPPPPPHWSDQPVVPLVYMMVLMSSAVGGVGSTGWAAPASSSCAQVTALTPTLLSPWCSTAAGEQGEEEETGGSDEALHHAY